MERSDGIIIKMHPTVNCEFVFDVPPFALYERLADEKMWRAFTQRDASLIM